MGSPPPGWYPDPERPGGQRYYDGSRWTDQREEPPPAPAYPPPGYGYPAPGYGYPPPGYGYPAPGYGYPPAPFGRGYAGPPPWKGAKLGLAREGPGSLANPLQRLGAKALDLLVMLPVIALLVVLAVVLVGPHVGPLFPVQNGYAQPGVPGFFWIELTLFAIAFVVVILSMAYDAITTATSGRSLGKRWTHIRVVRRDGTPLGWGRAIGRAAILGGAGIVLNWIGLIDPLWCCWDENTQCLHDKAVGAVVVRD
jgi:uncharacterized RDD family membrane protein YckC